MHLESPWTAAPKEAEVDESTASATLIELDPNGAFAEVSCLLRKANDEMGISRGDGYTLSIGKWLQASQTVQVRYRLVYQTVEPVGGGKYPGPEKQAEITVKAGVLTFDGKRFERSPSLETDVREVVLWVKGVQQAK